MADLSNLTFQDLQRPEVWAQMRQEQPVCQVPSLHRDDLGDLWVVAGDYDRVRGMLDHGSNTLTLAPVLPLPASAGRLFAKLQGLEPVSASGNSPEHDRYRAAHEALFP